MLCHLYDTSPLKLMCFILLLMYGGKMPFITILMANTALLQSFFAYNWRCILLLGLPFATRTTHPLLKLSSILLVMHVS